MFARIELRATAAPETIPAAPAKYIARLVIDAPAHESVTTYIYFDADFQGGPMTVDITDFSAALVYRCLVVTAGIKSRRQGIGYRPRVYQTTVEGRSQSQFEARRRTLAI